jgi:hypothetical protein
MVLAVSDTWFSSAPKQAHIRRDLGVDTRAAAVAVSDTWFSRELRGSSEPLARRRGYAATS